MPLGNAGFCSHLLEIYSAHEHDKDIKILFFKNSDLFNKF